MRTLIFILLCALGCVAQLPDAPQPQPRLASNGKPILTNRQVLTSKKFYIPALALIGATIYDVEVTHQGIAHHRCVEAHGDPYPSRGSLYLYNGLEDAGIIGLGFVIEKAHIPWVSAGMSLFGTGTHIYGGTKWFTDGCY